MLLLFTDVLNKIGQAPKQKSESHDSHYAQIFRLKVVHLIAFFSFAYVGAEITMGGAFFYPHGFCEAS